MSGKHLAQMRMQREWADRIDPASQGEGSDWMNLRWRLDAWTRHCEVPGIRRDTLRAILDVIQLHHDGEDGTLLEFGVRGHPLTAGTIADWLGIHRTTVYRLLACLDAAGITLLDRRTGGQEHTSQRRLNRGWDPRQSTSGATLGRRAPKSHQETAKVAPGDSQSTSGATFSNPKRKEKREEETLGVVEGRQGFEQTSGEESTRAATPDDSLRETPGESRVANDGERSSPPTEGDVGASDRDGSARDAPGVSPGDGLNVGQRMVLTALHPLPGESGRAAARRAGGPASMLSQGRKVARYSDLAGAVLEGTLAFGRAYEQAQWRERHPDEVAS